MLIDNRKRKTVTIEEVDKIPPTDEPTAPIDLDSPEPEGVSTEEPVEETVQETTEETPEEVKEEPKEEVKEIKQEDFEKRYKDSSREALTQHFKIEKLSTLLTAEMDVSEPTDDEMKSYARQNDAEYDELDAFSKNILKKQFILEKKEAKRSLAFEEMRKIDLWSKKVDEFVTKEENLSQFPSLEGQEKDFKDYCMKETSRGVDFNLLIGSFLYNNDKPLEGKKKGSLFLSRGNGRTEPAKPAGLSASEVETIRIKNAKEYKRLIKAGAIKIDF